MDRNSVGHAHITKSTLPSSRHVLRVGIIRAAESGLARRLSTISCTFAIQFHPACLQIGFKGRGNVQRRCSGLDRLI
ncbi:uncharacterized protein ARMOST_11784 [Armillaria ostoyae]|uniref:Uncharacterized protein n=1 Tax=Armillaria ostoyae TaxID=47428 RepID=A0A284RI37_ARMOS|nr:uncharacterized protein ARMOST_11784 [Armillaria ostoyae]